MKIDWGKVEILADWYFSRSNDFLSNVCMYLQTSDMPLCQMFNEISAALDKLLKEKPSFEQLTVEQKELLQTEKCLQAA